jgi:hypothetical protein
MSLHFTDLENVIGLYAGNLYRWVYTINIFFKYRVEVSYCVVSIEDIDLWAHDLLQLSWSSQIL